MKRIIIVEDDPGTQDAFSHVFDPDKFQVTVFSSGYPVLKEQYEIPDLFILDKQLSGVDGLDLCRYLKSEPATKHVPVIMLSASPDIYRLAMQAGADDALEKPFALNVLRNMANRHVGY